MKITPNLSFTGYCVAKNKIHSFNNATNQYEEKPVSFVELDPQESNDIKSIEKIYRKWDNENQNDNAFIFFVDIADRGYGLRGDNPKSFYVLTEQNYDYDNLNSEKFLGICETERNKKSNFSGITILQKSPFANVEENVEKLMASNLKEINAISAASQYSKVNKK